MSRGTGSLQERIIQELTRRRYRGLTLLELRGEIYGWRPCRRGVHRDGSIGHWTPVSHDDHALRRALDGLIRREQVTVVHMHHTPRGHHRRRYVLRAPVDDPPCSAGVAVPDVYRAGTTPKHFNPAILQNQGSHPCPNP